jgi:hypothetical protein
MGKGATCERKERAQGEDCDEGKAVTGVQGHVTWIKTGETLKGKVKEVTIATWPPCNLVGTRSSLFVREERRERAIAKSRHLQW